MFDTLRIEESKKDRTSTVPSTLSVATGDCPTDYEVTDDEVQISGIWDGTIGRPTVDRQHWVATTIVPGTIIGFKDYSATVTAICAGFVNN